MASLPITAAWESSPGVPATGLANTPTIRIRRMDTQALVVTDDAMTETGDGVYQYDFTPPDDEIAYSIRSDGDPTAVDQVPGAIRYQYGQVDMKLTELWQFRGSDPANPKTTTENTPETDYDEVVDGKTISHVKVAGVTTSTRS